MVAPLTIRTGAAALPAMVAALAVALAVAFVAFGMSRRVFDRFYCGEKSRSREFGGTGLWLAIAKGIVEAHGGKVWVESGVGAGSGFSFSLPRSGPQGVAV